MDDAPRRNMSDELSPDVHPCRNAPAEGILQRRGAGGKLPGILLAGAIVVGGLGIADLWSQSYVGATEPDGQTAALWSPSGQLGLGSVNAQVHTVRAMFTNRSSDEVRIVRAVKSCDCADVSWPETAIRPGDEVAVSCKWDLTGKSGSVRTTILLECLRGNSIKPEVVSLTLIGDVTQPESGTESPPKVP